MGDVGYRSLSVRTMLATIAIALAVLTACASDVVGLATAGDGSDGVVWLSAGLGLCQFGAAVLGAIFVCVWMHCAASNLRVFGHRGLQFTPAGAAGWWFVPFANLVKPYQAMREIVGRSEPSSLSDGYWSTSSSGTVSIGWGAWIASNVIANVSMRIDDPGTSAGVSLVSSMCWAVAGVLLVTTMRHVEASQDECDRRLRAALPPVAPYRSPWSQDLR